MSNLEIPSLKEQVREFWDKQSCGTEMSSAAKFSRRYFEEIESFRYFDQPFIPSFAQFSRYHGKRVLEVGCGAGTDFVQWLRCGARATAIDLTAEALEHVRHRIALYGLPKPERMDVGDAEQLPFETNSFDLGYSFGVLHHSPDTERAVGELVRVVQPGGEIKIMLYNRHSVYVFNTWLKQALLKGRPWKDLGWTLWHHVESIGTKGYTRKELVRWLARLPLDGLHIHTEVASADYLSASAMAPLNRFYRLCLRLSGPRQPWLACHYAARVNDPDRARGAAAPRPQRDVSRPLLTGNRWGFFHCISARKLG